MTPAARVQAAIETVERIAGGQATEAALLAWARSARYAGSKDRAAVRDMVFDVRRKWASSAWVGGEDDARARLWGWCHLTGLDPDTLFTAEGHAPEPWAGGAARSLSDAPQDVQSDCPAWMLETAPDALDWQILRMRAPVTLRAMGGAGARGALMDLLEQAGFAAEANPLSDRAVTLAGQPRGLMNTNAWRSGAFDLQDAASQWALDLLGDLTGQRVLDYCAGGGGKSIGLADQGAQVTAHDASAARLRAVPERAERLGFRIEIAPGLDRSRRFDVVVCDLPCSGSGTWRRTPDAKWNLTPQMLDKFAQTQVGIALKAHEAVASGGRFVVMTCSVFAEETTDLTSLLSQTFGPAKFAHSRLPDRWGDGFFVAEW